MVLRTMVLGTTISALVALAGCAAPQEEESDASEDAVVTANGVSVRLCSMSPGSSSTCPKDAQGRDTEIQSPLAVGSTYVLIKAAPSFVVSAQVGRCSPFHFVSPTTNKRGVRWGYLECPLGPSDTTVAVTVSAAQDPAPGATKSLSIAIPRETSRACRGGGWFCDGRNLLTCSASGEVLSRVACPNGCQAEADPTPDHCK
jgi:hypothetical protein